MPPLVGGNRADGSHHKLFAPRTDVRYDRNERVLEKAEALRSLKRPDEAIEPTAPYLSAEPVLR
jgi:hypothetical protein